MPKATWKEAVVVGYMFRSAFEVDHLLAFPSADVCRRMLTYTDVC